MAKQFCCECDSKKAFSLGSNGGEGDSKKAFSLGSNMPSRSYCDDPFPRFEASFLINGNRKEMVSLSLVTVFRSKVFSRLPKPFSKIVCTAFRIPTQLQCRVQSRLYSGLVCNAVTLQPILFVIELTLVII
jgi:hypothetical protein